jgi:large subunit ribosomal protein L32
MRHTRAHTANRRSHHALKTKNLIKCAKCDAFREPHTVCKSCGDYNGRTVINTLKKVEKKAAKLAPKPAKEKKEKLAKVAKAKPVKTKAIAKPKAKKAE